LVGNASERKGKWTPDEDDKLKDAVRTHGGNDWDAITALVPGRTRKQCQNRWHHNVNPIIDRTSGRKGSWTPDEDRKLKDAVRTHGGKDWAAIAALVLGRTNIQCYKRWLGVLDRNASERKGRWTQDEDDKLKDAVRTYGGKNWVAISVLVPGRTHQQCQNRWYNGLDPNIDGVTKHAGTWTEEEDSKLEDAVQTHGGKNWAAIAVLVPGRTKIQCSNRWHHGLDPNIDRVTGRKGKWTADEDELPGIPGPPRPPSPHSGVHLGAGQGISRLCPSLSPGLPLGLPSGLSPGLSPGPPPGPPYTQHSPHQPHPPQGYYQPLYPQLGQDPGPSPQYPPQRGYEGGGYLRQHNVPPPIYPYMPPYGMYPPYQHPTMTLKVL
jgi:hypothetical protein